MKELKKTFDSNKKLGIRMISEHFVNCYNIKTIKEGVPEMYYYKDGIYTRAEQQIERDLSELLEQEYTVHHRNEIFNQIHAQTYVDRKEFNVDKYLINLNNGIYSLRTGAFFDHSPEHLFFTKMATDYDPEAKCEKLDAFFKQLLPLEDILLLKQWFGYCLFRDYFIKKAIIMTGEKNTGKTTVIDVFTKVIGLDNVSGVSLQEMANDKFSIAGLYGKHVNIFDDMSASDVKDGGRFKMVTGKSPISAEYKHGNRFSFYNYAKLTFACNRIPSVEDNDDDAYFERWIVVKFTKTVTKPDKFLLDKIATPDQLSGLLNDMIIQLNKLIVNQEFSYNKDHKEIRAEMLRSGSPVASFTYDCLEEAIGNVMSKSDLHFWFSQYARINNLPHMEIKKFGKELIKYARYCTEGRNHAGKTWNNVKINDEYRPILEKGATEDISNDEGGSGDNASGLPDSEGGQSIETSGEISATNPERTEEGNSDEDNELRGRLDEAI